MVSLLIHNLKQCMFIMYTENFQKAIWKLVSLAVPNFTCTYWLFTQNFVLGYAALLFSIKLNIARPTH